MATGLMEKKEQDVVIAPWGIEIDMPRNNDCLLQSIPGVRMRSAISASRTVTDARTGDKLIPPDQANFLGQLPPMPGMQLHVNPAKLSYAIIDPLADDEQLCERITRSLERVSTFRSGNKMKGVEPQRGTLDEHRMKTLLREMLNLVNSGEAKVCKGSPPTIEQVDGSCGRYLLNPGSRVANTQPRFADQFEDWVSQMSKAGG